MSFENQNFRHNYRVNVVSVNAVRKKITTTNIVKRHVLEKKSAKMWKEEVILVRIPFNQMALEQLTFKKIGTKDLISNAI